MADGSWINIGRAQSRSVAVLRLKKTNTISRVRSWYRIVIFWEHAVVFGCDFQKSEQSGEKRRKREEIASSGCRQNRSDHRFDHSGSKALIIIQATGCSPTRSCISMIFASLTATSTTSAFFSKISTGARYSVGSEASIEYF